MHNAKNERIKRRYFSFLKEANRYDESTVDAVACAIAQYESYTKRRDFASFHFEQAVAFKRHLANQPSGKTGKPLSKATQHSTLGHLKRFFRWLAWQPGYKSGVSYPEADYFNMSDKDSRVATARHERPGPPLESVIHVLRLMPTDSAIQLRDRALVAFLLLTGARDTAAASFRLKHLDLRGLKVHQDAREVRTKNSKTFVTYFFPVGEEVLNTVVEWERYLRHTLLWTDDDPLFPATKMVAGPAPDFQFQASGLSRVPWKSAATIRKIFREAFERAGLPYYNPHSLRKTLTQLGETLCRTPEELKAWSQNLGHEGVLTTLFSYGNVQTTRQGQIMRDLAAPRDTRTADIRELARVAQRVADDLSPGR